MEGVGGLQLIEKESQNEVQEKIKLLKKFKITSFGLERI